MESILAGWEDFALKIWPGVEPTDRSLRDHAEEMLRAVVEDMQTPQSDPQKIDKSKGESADSQGSALVDLSSTRHAVARVESGFDLRSLVAEYRALRASVLRLWSLEPGIDPALQMEDITRFNEAMDQLLAESISSYSECLDHSREIFIRILGHDLRTPLHVVSMGAAIMESHCELSGLGLKMASQIATSVREMERMFRDLLDFTCSRLGAKMVVARAPTDMGQLCGEVLEELREAHPARDFRFKTSGEIVGQWDRSRVRQLISILLGNAVQHGSTAAPIHLSLEAADSDILIGVRNEGKAIPKDAITRIFDPLRRDANDELTRPAGSIGLGLYIAREVASAHGGTIHVTSDDKETMFLARLPGQDIVAAR